MLLFYVDSNVEVEGVAQFPDGAVVLTFGFIPLKKITKYISQFEIDEGKTAFPYHLIDDDDLKYATRKIVRFLKEPGWGKGYPRFPIPRKRVFWIEKDRYEVFLQVLETELSELIESKGRGRRSKPIAIPKRKEVDQEESEERYLRVISDAKKALKRLKIDA
jgi:hypothetical protein